MIEHTSDSHLNYVKYATSNQFLNYVNYARRLNIEATHIIIKLNAERIDGNIKVNY